jgi:hypothetical protein
MRPLIIRFLGRLEQSLSRIVRLLGENGLHEMGEICLDLAASAEGYGYPDICELLSGLHYLCGLNSPLEQIRNHVDELGRICESAMMIRQVVPKT